MAKTNNTQEFDKTVELPKLEASVIRRAERASLIVPESHQERMEWIRSSFQSFFRHVEEKEALLNLCKEAQP